MAYFSNSSEGDAYQATWCRHCENSRDRDGGRGDSCPVWDLAFLWNGDEFPTGNHDVDLMGTVKKQALDWFIPRGEKGYPAECRMFLELPGDDDG